MVLLVGDIVRSGGIAENPRIAAALRSYRFDDWPPYDSIIGASPLSPYVNQLPVSVTPRTHSGQFVATYSDDWYHRVHIFPAQLDVGNITSTQVTRIHVWNAWLRPVTLTSIDGTTDGISLEGIDTFPATLAATQLAAWDLSVTPDGPSTIDVSLTWNFSDSNDVTLALTGQRLVAWTLLPDWGEGIRERLAWETDILTSDERDEQRRAARISPLRVFDVPRMLFEGRERLLFDLQVRAWGGQVWALPVWPDIQRVTSAVALGATSIVCATTGRDFRAGGLAMLRGASVFESEVVEIQSVASGSLTLARPTQNAWPARTRLYPVRTARFATQPEVRRLSDTSCSVSASFALVEPSDWPEAALPAYRGFPVFESRPDETEDLTGTLERAMFELQNPSGFPFVLDAGDAALGTQAHRWVLSGIAERSAFRSLLYTLRGRQVSVWLPTHADDMRLATTISSAAVLMTIENMGYARFGLGRLGRQDIRIELRSGTVFYRRITNAASIDEATEAVTLDTSLGVNVAPADVRRISFMMLARSASDVTELQHVTDVEGVATSRKVFVGVKDEA